MPASALAATNLLVNPGAEAGSMAGWTVVDNGGNGWAVGFDGHVHSGTYSFATSYGWDTRYQKVDLLANRFTEQQLDSGTYTITFSEWIASRSDKGAHYYVIFKLLGADGDPSNPLATYASGSKASPNVLGANGQWFEVSYTFSGFPRGVRYAYIEDGGRDSQDPGWAGQYGAHFDDASITVNAPAAATESDASSGGSGSGGGSRGKMGTQRIVDALRKKHAAAPSPSSPAAAQSPKPAEDAHPAPAFGGTPESSLQSRTCARVTGWFAGNEKMLSRVNERLMERFGFMCEA